MGYEDLSGKKLEESERIANAISRRASEGLARRQADDLALAEASKKLAEIAASKTKLEGTQPSHVTSPETIPQAS